MNKTFLFVLILLLAFLMRVHTLDDMQLATDEDFTLQFADEIRNGDYENVIKDPSPPFYYFFIAFFKEIYDSVYFLRFITVLISLLSLTVFYFLSRKIFSSKGALLATILLAFNPAFFIFSRHLRNYALLTLFFILSCYFLYQFVFEKKDRALWLLALMYVLMLYTNILPVFLILSHILFA